MFWLVKGNERLLCGVVGYIIYSVICVFGLFLRIVFVFASYFIWEMEIKDYRLHFLQRVYHMTGLGGGA